MSRTKLKVTYACQHTGLETIPPDLKEAQIRKTLWLLSRKVCKQCWLDKKIEEDKTFIEQVEKTSGFNFPELQGSDAQIAWASRLRAEIISYIIKHIKETQTELKKRNLPLREQFIVNQRIYQLQQATEILLADEDEAYFWIQKRNLPFLHLVEEKIRHYNLAH